MLYACLPSPVNRLLTRSVQGNLKPQLPAEDIVVLSADAVVAAGKTQAYPTRRLEGHAQLKPATEKSAPPSAAVIARSPQPSACAAAGSAKVIPAGSRSVNARSVIGATLRLLMVKVSSDVPFGPIVLGSKLFVNKGGTCARTPVGDRATPANASNEIKTPARIPRIRMPPKSLRPKRIVSGELRPCAPSARSVRNETLFYDCCTVIYTINEFDPICRLRQDPCRSGAKISCLGNLLCEPLS